MQFTCRIVPVFGSTCSTLLMGPLIFQIVVLGHVGDILMSFPYLAKHSNGEILTGRLWRLNHAFFQDLPFYSDILRMDYIVQPLQEAPCMGSEVGGFSRLLVVR